ncbi:TPA: hypothetical protein K8N36_000899 [Clostridium perfringens]|uniref:Uncharacterized protein n=2 Tax=Clostridium perfringens TaxID=1502 RepID=A0AAN5SFS4_CLOPF|nr:hypothetical protein [Clostridium perfringens]EIA17469.1 hypothetical protein HA1_06487 [Clostridium perfringens F262]MDM0592775.1 hypothetical protein [Clostridium perfringens]MDM0595774.1 hypothetical protein [Clostridium perfringens]MDU1256343.1 hypothetical protein [Clostridium perfringens]MDU7550117.1 hypothetical protein [Clostridium perfringens]
MANREDYIKSLKKENEYLRNQLEVAKSERNYFKELADRCAIKLMKYENISEKDIIENLKNK